MSKRKVTEICIQESRDFFGNILADMVTNISKTGTNSESDRKSLTFLQTVWIEKYNPKRRMPEKPHVERIDSQMRKRKSRSPLRANSLIAKINILESDCKDLHKVDDNERIAIEIEVPQLYNKWKCCTFTVTAPARAVKEKKIEALLTVPVLRNLMHVPPNVANRLLQDKVDNEFNYEIDDALLEG